MNTQEILQGVRNWINTNNGAYDISAKTGDTYLSLSDALANVPNELRRGGMSIKFIQTTLAKYTVIKTEDIVEQPTGTEIQNDPGVNSGTYSANELSAFSSLPATLNSSITYYLAVTETVDEQEVTTYTTWDINKATDDIYKYVQYRLMDTAWSTDVANWQGVDDEPTPNSENLVMSGGVYEMTKDVVYDEFKDVERLSYRNFYIATTTWGNAGSNRTSVSSVKKDSILSIKTRTDRGSYFALVNTVPEDEDIIPNTTPLDFIEGMTNIKTIGKDTTLTFVVPCDCFLLVGNINYNAQSIFPQKLVASLKNKIVDSISDNPQTNEIPNELAVVEYTEPLFSTLEIEERTAIEFSSIVKGTLWKIVIDSSNTCLAVKDWFFVKGKITCFQAADITIRIVQYNENKEYITQTDYGIYTDITLDKNTRYVRIGANYRGKGYSDENPISVEDYTEGDFGFTYTASKIDDDIDKINNDINSLAENINDDINDLAENINALEQGNTPSVIGRNVNMDTAVRATGTIIPNSSDIKPLSFLHISDTHTTDDSYKCLENACEFLEHYSNIEFMINTGDLIYNTFLNPMTWYDLALEKTTKPVLNVIGNHDVGNEGDIAHCGTDVQVYEKYIAPYVSDWGVTQPSDAATLGKSYYYKDFTTQKIRLIVLNEFESDMEPSQSDPSKLAVGRYWRVMRQAQVTWLINTLGSTPSDYGVIVAYHQPGNYFDGNEHNEFVSISLLGNTNARVKSNDPDYLEKILNTFATKTSLSLTVTQQGVSDTTLDCSCDFTSAEAEFICILNGHRHQDYIGHLRDFPALTVLCVGCGNIKGATCNKFCPRAAGAKSEDLFNVVNIDRNRKTIKIIRIGSDASVTGQRRDMMMLSYATA